jgi:hypothetical protein
MTNKIDSCRGDEKKQQICSDYEVKVISRMALLPGHKIEGCYGDLENEHTIFFYKHKKSGEEDTFSVGKNCAKAFPRIIKQELPPLVDPLQDTLVSGGAIATGGSSPEGRSFTQPCRGTG